MPREVNTSRGFFVSSLKVGKRVRVHNIYNSAPESLHRENSANRVSVHKFYISAPESRFKISLQKVLFFLDLPYGMCFCGLAKWRFGFSLGKVLFFLSLHPYWRPRRPGKGGV